MKNRQSLMFEAASRAKKRFGGRPTPAHFATVAALCVLALGVSACEKVIHTRGNLPNKSRIAEIEPGRHARADVKEMLGSPSTRATFEKEIWYYIGSRVEESPVLQPKLLERRVLTVRFRKDGVVEEVRDYDATKGQKVKLVERQTPTRGKELTFLQQLLGNIGRFGDPRKGKADPF
jgi:outer membrane protein assembly factor BamE (lipoprotein component of BamABCDE complex)